jgi:hypothetical protein
VLIIHWRHDILTPRGPSLETRPRPDQIARWARETGRLQLVGEAIDLPPWHFGMRLRKDAANEPK